jgi:hypothetical protein
MTSLWMASISFEKSSPLCMSNDKYQLWIDIQPEHNYIIRYYTTYQLHVSAIGHHQVVLSLQSITYSVYLVGDEISFTMVRYMNSLNRMVTWHTIYNISTKHTVYMYHNNTTTAAYQYTNQLTSHCWYIPETVTIRLAHWHAATPCYNWIQQGVTIWTEYKIWYINNKYWYHPIEWVYVSDHCKRDLVPHQIHWIWNTL